MKRNHKSPANHKQPLSDHKGTLRQLNPTSPLAANPKPFSGLGVRSLGRIDFGCKSEGAPHLQDSALQPCDWAPCTVELATARRPAGRKSQKKGANVAFQGVGPCSTLIEPFKGTLI